jgi:hypothetical protein
MKKKIVQTLETINYTTLITRECLLCKPKKPQRQPPSTTGIVVAMNFHVFYNSNIAIGS